MSNLLKNLLIALALAILLWVGYVFLLPSDESSILPPESLSAEANAQAEEFRRRIVELDSMSIEIAILSDSRFTSLIDFRQDIGVEPFGRKNPFAPVE